MKYKAIIIDDEQLSIDALEKVLAEFCSIVDVVEKTTSSANGIQLINKIQPDIVFLDIEMPGLNGFDVLESVSNRNFQLIFITAYDHYAVKAFKVNAIDYILKPINIKEVIHAVNKAAQFIENKKNPIENYSNLVKDIRNNNSPKIQLSVQKGIELVSINEIMHIMADGRYAKVYLQNGSNLFVTKTLKEIEKQLNYSFFFRVHKSHLVNLNFIKKYNLVSNYQLELFDGTIVDISRRKKDDFIEVMAKL